MDGRLVGAVLRGILVGFGAAAYAWCALPLLLRRSPIQRRLAWGLFLVPFLTPVLVTGYAYSNTLLISESMRWVRDGLYVVVLWARLAPFAGLMLLCYRPLESSQARHCRGLLRGSGRAGGTHALRAWLPGLAAGCGLVFLMAFTEMELASLLVLETWTVTLFDAQVGGLPIARSLLRILLPLSLESLVLATCVWVVARGRFRLPDNPDPQQMPSVPGWLGWLVLSGAAVVGSGLPFALVCDGLGEGTEVVFRHRSLLRAIGVGLLFAGCSSALAIWCGEWISQFLAAGRWLPGVALVPGLFGPLVLGLLGSGLFVLPGLRVLRAGPAPTVIFLTLLLLPYAVMLALARRSAREPIALHCASLLTASVRRDVCRAGSVRCRRMLRKGLAGSCLLLFWLGYFELTVAAILSPPGLTPVSVRLYNLVHYGQTPALSAMLMLACIFPLIVLTALMAARFCFVRSRRA